MWHNMGAALISIAIHPDQQLSGYQTFRETKERAQSGAVRPHSDQPSCQAGTHCLCDDKGTYTKVLGHIPKENPSVHTGLATCTYM